MGLLTRKITTYLKNIVDLSDTPNKDGMTAADLKAFFDGRTDAEIKNSINGIIDDLLSKADGSSGADQVGLTPLKVGGAGTVQSAMEELKSDMGADLSTHTNRVDNPHAVTKAQVGLGNVTNESKATMFTNPTFTGTVSGVTKAMVGLINADNTSDANKPVSTATQTALDGKVDKIAGKGLSTNDYDNTEKGNVASNTSARHTHANKALLDTYTQTETDIADAVTKKHTHTNKSVLDGITEVTTVLGNTTNKVPSEKAVADAISFAGGGDMLKATYDPTNKSADAFSMANMVEGTTNKILTATERLKLDGIEANANNYVHPTTSGNKHIPLGGASNQYLKYSASGTAVWASLANNLTTTTEGTPLDATQGKVLNDIVSSKSAKSTIQNKTLSAGSWTGSTAPFSYSLTVTGVTTTSVQEVLPTTDITQTQLTALLGATIQDGGQSANTIVLKAWGTKPTIDLPIRVILRGDI